MAGDAGVNHGHELTDGRLQRDQVVEPERREHRLAVGAVDLDPAKIGQDLGEGGCAGP